MSSESATPMRLDAGAVLADARGELAARFGWLADYMPTFMPEIETDGELKRAFAAYLAEKSRAGMIENIAEAMDGARLFFVETVCLRMASVVHQQMKRLQATGTLDSKDAFKLQKLMDAFARVNKIAVEIKDSAAMSRRSRMEMGMAGGNPFQKLLADLQSGDVTDSARDVSVFLIQGRPKKLRGDEDQTEAEFSDIATAEIDRPLDDEEMRFLMRREATRENVTPLSPPVNGGRSDAL